jgi:hypothetical protein
MYDAQRARGWAGRLALFAAALGGAALGIFLVLPLGLVVVGTVVVPLALFEGALLAAVGASWAGVRVLRDQPPQFLAVIAVTLTVGSALALVLLRASRLADGPLAGPGILSSLALGASAAVAAYHFGSATSDLRRGRQLMVAALVVGVLIVPVVVGLAARAGLTGA